MCAAQHGPDWMDLLSTFKELEETHKAVIVLHMWSDGLHKGGQFYVCLSAHSSEGLLQSLGERPAVWDYWPTRSSAAIPALIHRLACELDYKLTKHPLDKSHNNNGT